MNRRLPIEVLRIIAYVGTCETALTLSKVSQILRSARNDHLVYKATIDNCHGNAGWQHHLLLSQKSELPNSSWERYALADSKAAQEHSVSLKPRVSWVPQLMVYHGKILIEQESGLSSVD